MDPALAGLPAREFPEPAQAVTFQQWQRGPEALSYDPYYVAPTAPTTTEETTTTPAPQKDSTAKPKPAAPAAKGSTPSTGAADTSSGRGGASANGGRPPEP
jgi:hypothetical protein